jgi:phosphoserine phosphatase
MKYVLTLIGNPAGPGLDPEEVDIARAALEEAGAAAAEPDWLAPELACDIAFAGLAPDEADGAVRQYLRDAPVDIVAQENCRRAKKLLVADMDSTIIEEECIDELADYMGLRDQVAAITERTMRGELDFAQSLRARAAMLGGLSARALDRAFNDRITYATGAHRLIRTMRARGADTALISGGFSYFTERVRLALGFTVDEANRLEIRDGVVTGEVGEPILDPGGKLGILARLAGERELDLVDTLTVGDGANDIPMIQAAGLGVAYHAKPQVAVAAKARIDHGDLTALLYAQGYRASEHVE